MKKIRWRDLPMGSKIVVEVLILAVTIFAINSMFYIQINNSMQEMDNVYVSNAGRDPEKSQY